MSEKRRSPSANERTILYSEVEGLCPRCSTSLNYKKNGKLLMRFDAAHIYPLNPSEEEKQILENLPKICADVNSLDNFIALCKNCHLEFDTPRTLDEYMELYKLKNNILRYNSSLETYQRYQIEEEIIKILGNLLEVKDEELIELSLTALKIETKDDGTLEALTKRSIKKHIVEYYLVIQMFFRNLEGESEGGFVVIASQVKSYSVKLHKEGHSQEEIYHTLAKWISKRSGNALIEACNIIVSFFIQNCEVFNDSTK